MKTKLFLIAFFLLASNSFASIIHLSPYAAIGFGNSDFEESLTSSGNTLDHTFKNFNFSLGSRLGAELFGVQLGFLGEFNQVYVNGDRQDQSTINITEIGYDLEIRRFLLGVYAGYRTDIGITIWGEYFPKVTSRISYSDGKDENLFRTGDKIKGDAWSIGFGFRRKEVLGHLSFVYRVHRGDEFNDDGVIRSLPSSDVSEYEERSFFFNIMFDFGGRG